jgi:membrane protein DedA with SNARE-associated domain
MDLTQLFSHYGYLMLLFGSLGEGMPIMLFGGFAAHRGWLVLIPSVILTGAIGNALAQGIWFLSARYAGRKFLERRADWTRKVQRADQFLEKWEASVVVGARFLPGFSTAATIAIALSNISQGKFWILNAFGALIWASVLGVFGYLLGQAVEALVGDMAHYEKPIALALLFVAVIWSLWRHWSQLRYSKRQLSG